ncbi:MAG: hypothetical protein HYU41_26630 [Candidatus Rokubacteria bacterium]|nr:hypothetical protein [Candidatus Rokubacteria bacterium]
MALTIRKREVTDIRTLEKLVVEHIDGIEPGLTVIDSRLLLGHATIDLVAQDARGALVLVALGLRADEGMLLRIVDAYSWCLEYPESVQRHYPTLDISEARPPRVIFVMTRVPESFQRKIKQLSFTAVDAVEFHALEIDGTAAVFFDTVARVRRSIGVESPADIAAPAAPVSEAALIASEIAARRAVVPKRIEVPDAPVRLTPVAAVGQPVTNGIRLIAGASDACVIDEPVTANVATAIDTTDAEAIEALIAEPVIAPIEAVAEAIVEIPEEAAKAAKLAEDLGIQLPKEGALTRQWIDFLNQLAAK